MMKEGTELKELRRLVSQCGAAIVYKPHKDEIDYTDSFPIDIPLERTLVPDNRKSDPIVWAKICIGRYKDLKPFILIPGKQFDIHGTRHGTGGGWYDRFLSKVPKEWLRIGVADKSKMSDTKLIRKTWDEPVDWVIVRDNVSWVIYKTTARLQDSN